MVEESTDTRRGIADSNRGSTPPSRAIHVHVAGVSRIVADTLVRLLDEHPDRALDRVATEVDDLIGQPSAGPDAVAVIDLTAMEPADAAEALDRLQRRAPGTVFVALRTMPDRSSEPEVVLAGTFHVVDGDETEGFAGAVREVARRQTVAAPACGAVRLSPRETEVLRLAATGRSNREIADTLYLSEHTVLGYLKGISAKLGVHSKLEAVVRAIAEGLIPVPGVDEIGAGRR